MVDNFEQLLDAAGELSVLLNASPRSKLVVTSRAPLRLAAEHELALGPLAAEPAAALFLRRARAVDPRLQLSNGDEPLIARICDRLDGLPLAIELAAARIKVLSPAEILDRLSRRLDLLSAGPRDAPQRQQTLRAAIGWSYDLLDAETKRLFCELGVFNGGFTLVAAEAVCGPAALDGIAALTDHSLLARGSDRRFTMLETVREYALERLEQSGRLDEVRDHHARAYVELLAGAEDGMVGAELPQWLGAPGRRPRQRARGRPPRDRRPRRRDRRRPDRSAVALLDDARDGHRGRRAGHRGARARRRSARAAHARDQRRRHPRRRARRLHDRAHPLRGEPRARPRRR